MGIIVAIGGGEIGRPGYKLETLSIDKKIVELSSKKEPNLLFIPTASGDSELYYGCIQKLYEKKLGCKCDVLYLIKEKPTLKEIRRKINWADIIYVGGGNTFRMMKIWREKKVDSLLKKAYQENKILCGLSAGSICWFRYGNSDSRKFKNPDADIIRVSGLNLISALHCPHYDIEKERKKELKKMMKRTPGTAIAMDNCCAIIFKDNTYKVIRSKKDSKAYKVFWKKGKYYEKEIAYENDFKTINLIVKK